MIRNQSLSTFASFLALASVLVIMAGCDDMDSGQSLVPSISSPSYPGLSLIEPPAPKYEPVPVLDSPQTTTWRPGYWSYNGNDFDWVDGEVIAKPSPTAVWYPSYWGRRAYGWAFVPGYWQ